MIASSVLAAALLAYGLTIGLSVLGGRCAQRAGDLLYFYVGARVLFTFPIVGALALNLPFQSDQ